MSEQENKNQNPPIPISNSDFEFIPSSIDIVIKEIDDLPAQVFLETLGILNLLEVKNKNTSRASYFFEAKEVSIEDGKISLAGDSLTNAEFGVIVHNAKPKGNVTTQTFFKRVITTWDNHSF